MDLEKVALEAVKIKIQEIFDEIIVSTAMEGRDIVIRISLPDEIMKNRPPVIMHTLLKDKPFVINSDLDKEAQLAANELLGGQEE